MGSAPNTVARIAARACSAAVASPQESCSLGGSPAVAGLAAGASGLAHRQGVASSGAIGAVGGALSVLVISSLAYRFQQLPSLMGGEAHGRWGLIALVGWAVTAWTWRDPARRRW